MLMRHGDIYECPQCQLAVQVIRESRTAPMQDEAPRCCCGERLVLVQSGSESVAGSLAEKNKIETAAH